MKKIVLTTIAIHIIICCFSQAHYREGYIITGSKDTLSGLVAYREGKIPYKMCSFKTSEGQQASTHAPNQIGGYGYTGDKAFVTREISLKNQPSQIVFLEAIVSGYVSLYRFESTFLIEKENQGLYHLTNEAEKRQVNGITYSRKTNQHIGVLGMIMGDADMLRGTIQRIKLGEHPLTRVVEEYNRFKNLPFVTYRANKPWFKPVVGIAAGLNISTMQYYAYLVRYSYLTGSFENYKSAFPRVSLELSSPKMSERVSLTIDFIYLQPKYRRYIQLDKDGAHRTEYVTIDLESLKIPLGLRYNFRERAVTPFISAGVAKTYHLSKGLTWVQEFEWSQFVETVTNSELEIERSQLGFWGGVGGNVKLSKRFNGFVEARYEKAAGVYKVHTLSSVTNFQIILGLSIN